MNTRYQTLTQHWQPIAPLLTVPENEQHYQECMDLLYQLIDEVGENEQHPLSSLLHFVGLLVAEYEEAHYPPPDDASAQDVLASLMQEHQLKQSDLPEIGSQGVVSEILRGKRQLNTRQIQALAERFSVSPNVFF